MKIKASDLRADVTAWLRKRLRYIYPSWDAQVYETCGDTLSGFLKRYGLLNAFPCSEAFEMELDITGVLRRGGEAHLVFVRCKTSPITLGDVGPMQEYSSLALPVLSIILSPAGTSPSLGLLFNAYNRVDVLEYGSGKRLKIGTWDVNRKQVRPASVIPPGELG